MSAVDLQTPIIDGGISSVNFFNGRLLTARDLSNEQSANREANRRLGQALGEGIAYGLEVSQSPAATKEAPVVTIESGLAVNRSGQGLKLANKTDVALVRQASTSTGVSTIFGECLPLQSGTYVAGAGVYLLTMAPAERRAGRAVTNGLDTAVTSCNTDATVAAVQFRLVQLDPPITAAELQDESHLRNLIAYRCFDLAPTKSFVTNPFGPRSNEPSLLDSLRPNRLTDCDVPLAILYWTLSDGIKFLDLWSVRRALTGRSYSGGWSRLFAERRLSESRAMFLQFADQIDDIRRNETGLATIAASQRFKSLPPAGFLPVIGPGSAGGFDPPIFFGALASRDVAMIDGELLRSLLNDALYHEPIDLNAPDKIQLYSIFENVKAVEQGNSTQLALVFARHTLPYLGVPRFGYAKWNLSRVAPSVI